MGEIIAIFGVVVFAVGITIVIRDVIKHANKKA